MKQKNNPNLEINFFFYCSYIEHGFQYLLFLLQMEKEDKYFIEDLEG